MAKSKEVTTKAATKKATKPTLSFTAGTEIKKETVNMTAEEAGLVPTVDTKPVAAKKDIETVSEPVIKHPVAKEPNLKQEVKETVKPVETASVEKAVTLPVEEVKHQTAAKPNYHSGTNKPFNRGAKSGDNKSNGKELPPINGQYPDHMVQIALIVKNNAEIRRFTSLGILNYLLQKGEIKGGNRFVSFKWNKFTVKFGNLSRDYSYAEAFFLNCLAASFASFSASAQKTIDHFVHKELNADIDEVLSNDAINAVYDSINN